MKTKKWHKLPMTCMITTAGFLLVSCGGGSGSDDSAPILPADFSGTWLVGYENDSTDCGEGIFSGETVMTIVQSGSNATVTDAFGETFEATISGNSLAWSGSFPEDGGTTTNEVKVTKSGNTVEGESVWTWTAGAESCSGVIELTYACSSGACLDTSAQPDPSIPTPTPTITPVPYTITGDFPGIPLVSVWTIKTESVSDSCGNWEIGYYDIIIEHKPDQNEVTASTPGEDGLDYYMTINSTSSDSITLSGALREDGGITNYSNLVLEFSDNPVDVGSSTITGSADWEWTDGEDSCAGSSDVVGGLISIGVLM